MKTYTVTVDAEEFQVAIENGAVVSVNGEPCGPVSIERTSVQQYSVLLDSNSVTIAASGRSGQFEAFVEARLHRVQVVTERERVRKQLKSISNTPAHTEVRAPMPAMVVKVEVSVGDPVREGQGLLILEAMKMENEIRAHTAGTVREIRVTAGKAVEKDELLLLLE